MRQTGAPSIARRRRWTAGSREEGVAMSDLYPVKPEFAARARIGKDDYQRLYR